MATMITARQFTYTGIGYKLFTCGPGRRHHHFATARVSRPAPTWPGAVVDLVGAAGALRRQCRRCRLAIIHSSLTFGRDGDGPESESADSRRRASVRTATVSGRGRINGVSDPSHRASRRINDNSSLTRQPCSLFLRVLGVFASFPSFSGIPPMFDAGLPSRCTAAGSGQVPAVVARPVSMSISSSPRSRTCCGTTRPTATIDATRRHSELPWRVATLSDHALNAGFLEAKQRRFQDGCRGFYQTATRVASTNH